MIGSATIQAGYRYALSLTHNKHNAEDIVQEACLKIYKKVGRIENKSLLFVTIRNLFIDRYRREQIIHFEPLDETMAAQSADDDIDADFTIQDLEKALETLRPEEREVIYLNYYESYSASEIGEITGKSRNTILSLLYRGKKKLADEIRRLTGKKEPVKERQA